MTMAGGLDSRGLQVVISEMRAQKTHTSPSSCKVKEVTRVQRFKYREYSTELTPQKLTQGIWGVGLLFFPFPTLK